MIFLQESGSLKPNNNYFICSNSTKLVFLLPEFKQKYFLRIKKSGEYPIYLANKNYSEIIVLTAKRIKNYQLDFEDGKCKITSLPS
jgi:hypothetical protein